MRNYTSENKPYWNARTSILDILVSQKRLHKPKTSALMLWIGSSKTGALSNYIIISNVIASFMILLYISHPCAALQNHNIETSQSSTIIYQTNNTA